MYFEIKNIVLGHFGTAAYDCGYGVDTAPAWQYHYAIIWSGVPIGYNITRQITTGMGIPIARVLHDIICYIRT